MGRAWTVDTDGSASQSLETSTVTPAPSPAGLVKAVNTAVDLIVAHFGTSRDPGIKVGWSSEELSCTLQTLLFVSRDGEGQREWGGGAG